MKTVDWRIVGVFAFVGVGMAGAAYLVKGPELFETVGGLRNFALLEGLLLVFVTFFIARR